MTTTHWTKEDIQQNHELREVLHYLYTAKTVSGNTKQIASHHLSIKLEATIRKSNQTHIHFLPAIAIAISHGHIHYNAQTGAIELSGHARTALQEMDIIRCPCGATAVQNTEHLCYNCGASLLA